MIRPYEPGDTDPLIDAWQAASLAAHPFLSAEVMDKAVALRGSLFLDVFKENSIGRAFYDRYGFRTAREHFHEQTGNALLRMEFG